MISQIISSHAKDKLLYCFLPLRMYFKCYMICVCVYSDHAFMDFVYEVMVVHASPFPSGNNYPKQVNNLNQIEPSLPYS